MVSLHVDVEKVEGVPGSAKYGPVAINEDDSAREALALRLPAFLRLITTSQYAWANTGLFGML